MDIIDHCHFGMFEELDREDKGGTRGEVGEDMCGHQ